MGKPKPSTNCKGSKQQANSKATLDDGGDRYAAVKRLASYGEAFMQMFDDYDEEKEAAATQQGAAAVQPGDDAAANSTLQAMMSQPRTASSTIDGGGAATTLVPGAAKRKAQQPRKEQPPLKRDMRSEWKMFMSPKAADVHRPAVVQTEEQQQQQQQQQQQLRGSRGSGGQRAGGPGVWADEDAGLSKEEFQKMQREVQLYGASGMDKRNKQAFEARMLEQLGAAAAKKPRVPANIGFGMAKKKKEREAAALELAFESGMAQRKGMGKKRAKAKLEAQGGIDRGLNEDGGRFRNGVMRVRPPPRRGSGKPKAGRNSFKNIGL